MRNTWRSWLETSPWDVDAVKRRRLNYIDYYQRLADKYYSKGFAPAAFCKDVGIVQTDKPTCWEGHLAEWYSVEDSGVARDFTSTELDTQQQQQEEEFINPTMMRPTSEQWHVHFTSNPIAAYLPFDRYSIIPLLVLPPPRRLPFHFVCLSAALRESYSTDIDRIR